MKGGSEKIVALVEDLQSDRPFSEDDLSALMASATAACHVPPLHRPDLPYTAQEFDGVADNAETQLALLARVLEHIKREIAKDRCFSRIFLKSNMVCCFLAACEFRDGSWEWSNEQTACVSKEVLRGLCEVVGCASLKEFLTGTQPPSNQHSNSKGHRGIQEGYLQQILIRLSENLNRKDWKSYPGLKMVYWAILQHLDHHHLGDYLAYLLPPALFIVDDWEQKNKILGINCLKYILDNTIGSELRWYGRAAVIYDALKPLVFSRESEVLDLLYPTIIQVASIIEADPATTGRLKNGGCYHSLLQQVLQDMSHEQKLCLRAVYSSVLPLLLRPMGILAVRFSNELLSVFADYLATPDGSAAAHRINILKGVKEYVQQCWPRVHVDAQCILKMVVRLLYDVTLEDSEINPQSIEVLCEEIRSVVHLLYAAAPATTSTLCRGLHTLHLHPRCHPHLQALYPPPLPPP